MSSQPTAHPKANAIQARLARDSYFQRRGTKSVLWVILPAVIIAGLFWPVLGLSVLLCMAGAIGVSFWRGRAWCDVCPRGTFLDLVMSRRGKRPIPRLLRTTGFRVFALAFIMGMMAFRLVPVWGDLAAMGRVFVQLLTVTTIVAVLLGLFFNPRSWCYLCPMGSMASWIGRRKAPLQVDDSACVSCGACRKACPMELNPEAFRQQGRMCHGDCLKCGACVVNCPKLALSWEAPAKDGGRLSA